MFGGNFAPQGWAACNGALLPISQNDVLFSLFSTTYGGDGSTTFGLPNLWGRVPIHDGNGRGLSTYVNGQTGGTEGVALLAAHHPAHTHTLSASTAAATQTAVKGNVLAAPAGLAIYYQGTPNRAMGNDSISLSPGTSQAHENRMPSLAITYIVALAGIFPSRP